MKQPSCAIELPAWVAGFLEGKKVTALSEEAMMDLVLAVTAEHVGQGSGGPFGAGVFTIEHGDLVALGLNLVTSAGDPLLHAEMVAIHRTAAVLGTWDLGGGPGLVLVSSAQPCVMCFGGVLWSGVRRLVYGARRGAVETLAGFDEGPLPQDWEVECQARGIGIRAGLGEEKACGILSLWSASQVPYNPSRNGYSAV